MNKAILIRFGEIFLKGKNKYVFENLLIKNILKALTDYNVKLTKKQIKDIQAILGKLKENMIA